jgi:ubiquinone/menaquinone biosynthesis C-methylase UbiE
MRMQKRPDAEEVRRTRDFYDWWAPFYDVSNWVAARLRGASDSEERRKAVEQLELVSGMRVIEVSCGTGTNLPLLRNAVGEDGVVVGLDISTRMLRRGDRKLRRRTDEASLVLGDAAKLPFADGSFDAVFHHGGLAELPNKRAAIAEMARVVKSGGKVVICDPGIPVDRPARWINRQLLKLQPAYAAPPPVRHLPDQAANVEISWIRGDGWYLLEFTKAAKSGI